MKILEKGEKKKRIKCGTMIYLSLTSFRLAVCTMKARDTTSRKLTAANLPQGKMALDDDDDEEPCVNE